MLYLSLNLDWVSLNPGSKFFAKELENYIAFPFCSILFQVLVTAKKYLQFDSGLYVGIHGTC